jgi:hypothetical protein
MTQDVQPPDPEEVIKKIEALLKRGHWQVASHLIHEYWWYKKQNTEEGAG